MFGSYKTLPTAAKITTWICLAHFWILLCAIVYVELEGFQHDNNIITEESELALNVLSGTNIKDIKTTIKARIKYKEDFNKKLETLKYWKKRKEFNDVSKVYVFVLLAHTRIGGYSELTLQTWQSQLFYIFTMPVGLLLYFLMIHSIVAEIFEVFAYAAVTIFQNPKLDWTVDQRELYEKCKVFFLSLAYMTAAIFLLGTIGILSADSYTKGVYHIGNMVLGVSYSKDLFPHLTDYNHYGLPIIMTFLTFVSILVFYSVTYSGFIMFRYNGISEILNVLFGYVDELDDVGTDDDMLEFESEHRSGDEQPFILHPDINTALVQPSPKQRHKYYKISYRSSSSSENEEEKQPQHQLTEKKITSSPNDPQNTKPLETNQSAVQSPQLPPSIQISSPSPTGLMTTHPFANIPPTGDFGK